MGKSDYEHGSATIQDFAYWINERHTIYHRRVASQPPPWSEDWIFNEYRFTNVFRELDHGTRVIRKILNAAIEQGAPDDLVLFNVIVYRYFNWWKNFEELGFLENLDVFEPMMRERHRQGEKVFTGSHMVTGRPGVLKIDSYLAACESAFRRKDQLLAEIQKEKSIENAFWQLKTLDLVGPFIAYEMASDLRWTPALDNAPVDRYTWANIGPGCKRGLHRLGLPARIESLQWLYQEIQPLLIPEMRLHLPEQVSGIPGIWPPFELREIEHVCCEFDKMMRVKTGAGRPRQKLRFEQCRELIL